jgi:hypothetical protein
VIQIYWFFSKPNVKHYDKKSTEFICSEGSSPNSVCATSISAQIPKEVLDDDICIEKTSENKSDLETSNKTNNELECCYLKSNEVKKLPVYPIFSGSRNTKVKTSTENKNTTDTSEAMPNNLSKKAKVIEINDDNDFVDDSVGTDFISCIKSGKYKIVIQLNGSKLVKTSNSLEEDLCDDLCDDICSSPEIQIRPKRNSKKRTLKSSSDAIEVNDNNESLDCILIGIIIFIN